MHLKFKSFMPAVISNCLEKLLNLKFWWEVPIKYVCLTSHSFNFKTLEVGNAANRLVAQVAYLLNLAGDFIGVIWGRVMSFVFRSLPPRSFNSADPIKCKLNRDRTARRGERLAHGESLRLQKTVCLFTNFLIKMASLGRGNIQLIPAGGSRDRAREIRT